MLPSPQRPGNGTYAEERNEMDFAEVVRKRRMVRHFRDEPVAPEAIERILDLARHAPSAGYTQGQSFVVVTDPAMKREIARLCGEEAYVEAGFHPFVSGAPVLVIPCTSEAAYHRRYQEPDKTQEDGSEIEWPVPYWHMDIGCSVMIVLLAAVAEGLDAGFAGTHDLDALRALLGIPAEAMPVGVIPIGHRAPDKPSPSLKRGRKPETEFVHRERW
jgi:nitroreductase